MIYKLKDPVNEDKGRQILRWTVGSKQTWDILKLASALEEIEPQLTWAVLYEEESPIGNSLLAPRNAA